MTNRSQVTLKQNRLAARKARLRYTNDQGPGIQREMRHGKPHYSNSRGQAVRDAKILSRIRALAIPPAWTDVWIATRANDHIQATGRDARGRKQYRYHSRWNEVRDANKYENLIAFAKALPKIRKHVDRDLRRQGLQRDKVLATVVRLLETSLIRVGNDEYAKNNGSFGLTTMLDRHADIRGRKVRFHFRAKSGIKRDIEINSPKLAKIVRRCQELPGQELFQYVDDDEHVRDVASADVNEYLRRISGREISAKDFRTWAGTWLAAQALKELEDFDTKARAKRNITSAIERVAARLGNTKAICRRCYVHPEVIASYLDRSLVELLESRTERELRTGLAKLRPEEAAVLALLQQRMKRQLGKGKFRKS